MQHISLYPVFPRDSKMYLPLIEHFLPDSILYEQVYHILISSNSNICVYQQKSLEAVSKDLKYIYNKYHPAHHPSTAYLDEVQ